MKKTTPASAKRYGSAKKKKTKKIVSVRRPTENALTKEDFLKEMEKISSLIVALKNEMNERFEKHENIILAEYRHRIEALETKVKELQTKNR